MNLELLYVNSPYACEQGNAGTTQTTRITRLFFVVRTVSERR